MKELFKEPVWDEERGFWHRGPADIYVGDEMKSYKALKQIPQYDCVFDIGAHVGWFTRYARHELNAKMVHAFEPDPGNTRVYRMNHNPGDYCALIALHEGAVMSNGADELMLQLSHKYPANNRSDRPIQGRHSVRVKVFDFQKMLLEYNPDLVKIDIEGAEYGLDMAMPPRVKAIAIEYHQFDDGMLDKQRLIHRQFLDQGFRVVTQPKDKRMFQKITTGVYLR